MSVREGVGELYDVLIIGSGAGGGPLALSLSSAGLRVLVLEKGREYAREAYAHGPGGLEPQALIPRVEEDPHTVVTRKTVNPLRNALGWTASCVGGATVHMGGYFYRFHPDDMRMRSRFGVYEELEDWPYDYDALEPWYGLAEREVGVSGLAGVNPFEGPRSTPYPMPPLEAHPLAEALDVACRRRGLHPFPTPRAINSRPYLGRPACAYCARCSGLGCPVGARGSSQEALLPRAMATGRCELRALAQAREVTLGADGRVSGCVYLDDRGREHRVLARVVCVCCSAVESARLLLLSRSPRFPDGLANGSGRVGRHLQFHGVTMARARLPLDRGPGATMVDPHPFIGRSVMDHYFLPDGVSELAKGGILRFGRMAPVPETLEGASSAATGELFCEVFHDFIPNARTSMVLDPEVKDRWGLPVARIHLDRPRHHVRAGAWLQARVFELFGDLGAESMESLVVGGTSSYLVHGTCRAGSDPATSVLDAHCQAHEVDNLFVVDGSFMPTSGGAAPTLTILANAFRTADHIARRFRAGDFG
ncbi:GMC family oxidoreductase [Myxococcus stipitatus]|uniref:GMC family oxidoreductase n=1 Tax=Myxococcus stipitatus TaxID=83455 RepID=UPI001F1B5F2F|nr:GMC family oxidoreductase [Myxococcus stipitatus]MCE9667132.1 GMC family oxidoreductase [Myxococcus stipitatus]